MRGRILLVLAGFFVSGAPLAQSTAAHQATTLKERGVPGLSLVAQSIVVKEAGGELKPRDREEVARDVSRYLVATDAAKAVPTSHSSTTPSYVAPAVTLLNEFAAETQRYDDERRHLQQQKLGNEQFKEVVTDGVVGIATFLGRPARGAVASAAVALGTWAVDVSVEQKAQALDAAYSQRLDDIVAVAVHQARNQPSVYHALGQAVQSGRPEQTKAALAALLGDQRAYFDESFLNKLNTEERQAVERKMALVLGDAFARAQQWNEQQFLDVRGEIRKNKAAITSISRELVAFEATTNAKVRELTELQGRTEHAVTALQTKFAELAKQNGENSADVQTLQQLMWGKLSPSEQLYALDHGFMRGLTPAQRDELRQALTKVATVTELRGKTQQALQQADGIATTLGNLHLVPSADIANLKANIGYANAAINVISEVAMGNWFSAASALGGLFGGGPDRDEEHFQAIMGKLDDILALQHQIIDGLNELSEQLAQSTSTLMGKLADLETKIDFTNELLVDEYYNRGKQACLDFETSAMAAPYDMSASGIFPSYASRVAHYEHDRRTGGDFKQCIPLLKEAQQLTSSGDAPRVLWVESLDVKNLHSYQQTRYAPVRELTLGLLNARADDHPFCQHRLLAALANAPEKFGDILPGQVTCLPDSDLATDVLAYRSWRGQPVDAKAALSHAVYFSSTQLIGDFLAFYAPYFEFMTPPSRASSDIARGLYTQKELAFGHYAHDEHPIGYDWFNHFLDIVNLQVAQETLYAGPFIAAPIADVLTRQAFGENTKVGDTDGLAVWRARWQAVEPTDDSKSSATKAEALRQQWAQATEGGKRFDTASAAGGYCGAGDDAFQPFIYQTVTCVMALSEPLRQNVVLYIVLDALQKSQMSEAAYRLAYYTSNRLIMSRLLPGLPVVYRSGDKQPGWFLQLRHHTGERWWLPLPTPFEVKSGYIHYSPVMQEALAYRDTVTTRLAYYGIQARPRMQTSIAQRALARLALFGQDFMLTRVYDAPNVAAVAPGSRPDAAATNTLH